MKRLFAAALILMAAGSALASGTSASLSWTLATQYTDGQTLPVSAIKETLIQWRRPGNPTVVGSMRIAAPGASVVVPGLVCGAFEFTATTILAAGPPPSDELGPVPYTTGVVCKPNPPSGLTAT